MDNGDTRLCTLEKAGEEKVNISDIIIIICLTTAAICAIFTYLYNRRTGNFQREINKRIKERRKWSSNEIRKSIGEYDAKKDKKMD